MGETAPRQRAIITIASKPVMPPYIKMRHDAGRNRWLILAPGAGVRSGRDRCRDLEAL